MKQKLLNEAPERTFAIVLDKGEEVLQQLSQFVRELKISGARITGLGAFESATLGFFERDRQDYKEIAMPEQVEVLSLTGDVALAEGEPKLHLHVVVGKKDGTAHGGHLLQAKVWPTLEIMLVESPGHLQRKLDPETRLPLIDLAE